MKTIQLCYVFVLFCCAAVSARVFADANQTQVFSPRITNASRAAVGQFPWHVSLIVQYRNDNSNQFTFCNGAILNDLWIIAAAECVVNARYIRADIGSVLINRPSLSVFPDTFFIHPQYNPNRFRNNLALLRLPLSRPLRFPSGPTPNFWPIRLPSLSQINVSFEEQEAYFSGFGSTVSINHNVSEFLSYAKQEIISNRACLGFYDNDSQLISPNIICSSSVDFRTGACRGDGGGPLVINEYGRWTLVGVLSFLSTRASCGRQVTPTAFTRITGYFDGIGRTTNYQFRP